MSAPKEIRTKIGSVKKTQKITSAMQMVAASKMRKAQERMEISMPYANKIREVMQHVSASNIEFFGNYLEQRPEVKRVGYIVISTNRGLCGALNISLFKLMLEHIREWQSKEVFVDVCLFGSKAQSIFKHSKAMNVDVLAQTTKITDEPQVVDLIGNVRVMLEQYSLGKIDRLFIVHNEFVSKMVQKPRIEQLLPLPIDDLAITKEKKHPWDYLYEADPKKMIDTLLTRYIEMQVYQAVVDNVACEQAARMVAMQSATDNAGEIIADLQLIYNKARQAAITQEISEIISGAEAV